MENNKYLLVMMVAKRAKELNGGAKPLVKSKYRQHIKIALEEIKAGKVYLKEEEEPLKAEQIFNEVEEPAKPEDISGEVKEPEKSEELYDEDEGPAEIEEIFDRDEEFGNSEGLLD
ncbi:DNA-directed RNA polymerase subunit omega [bacterium]|nr:DNA-directed RNA polymerase subunit omega [Candidatus Atribacteria bacterium]MBU1291102.1 DNA-directed RNA polymerase subunit omega [bacterium]MBU1428167.1 DNA-directed RNA polymerase subunit omega [bacterium]MBU4561862.1 DNA-directed RNA polymerase subunit omega [bacterium]